MARQFQGKVELDIRDSQADWDAFLDNRAPKGAPNVLVILFDDTGQAAWSPYGGRIDMPTLDRLAQNGLTYSQWHTTAVCSPTRSCFLTGRNHHANGFGSIAECATGFPGYSGHIPLENGTMASILRDAGWSTFWIGKNHNVPVDAFGMSASKKKWPLGLGYDRFYGFIGGETNQWYPELIEDNHYVDQPAQPEDGYHLSKDLADKAIQFIRDSKQVDAEKPWYMWFCPGANHAPHHAPQDYIDKYKGRFDDGYEAYRGWVLARMIERGILPEGTELTPINPMPADVAAESDMVRPWATLSDDEKRLFSRMAEVYAALSEYTDAQIGRVIEYLEDSGQLDNTLIFYCADNGASGEGSPSGSVNENLFFNGFPDDVARNLEMIDKLGSPATYNHYPTGWAVAFSTPYKMFKRYASFAGGTCDPLVIHWPKGIRAKGEVRHQYHHCTDIVPTILEACGVPMPDVIDGVTQAPLAEVSMVYSFDDAGAPTTKETQYFEMLGTRGIWSKGWKASALHAPVPSDQGHFDKDRWQLFHTDEDRSEARDLAARGPGRGRHARGRIPRAHAGPLCLLSRHDRGAGGLVGAHAWHFLQDAGRGRVHRRQPGCDRRAGLALRGLQPLREGGQAVLRLQLPWPPARAAPHLRRAEARQACRGRRVREGTHFRAARDARADDALRGRGGGGPGAVPHHDGALRALRRGAVHRLRRRRCRQRRVQAAVPLLGRPGDPGRLRHRR